MLSNAVNMLNNIVNSPLPTILAKVAFSVILSAAVIALSDWYSKGQAAATESNVRELEALFALRDPRQSPAQRARG
jgi:hypothetical protein